MMNGQEGNCHKLSSDRPLKSSDRDKPAITDRRITFSDVIDQFRVIFGVIFPNGLMKLFRRLFVLSFIQLSTFVSFKGLFV